MGFCAHREFVVHETLKLQFRAELFNVLNHPNFGPPVGDLSGFRPRSIRPATQMLGKASTWLRDGVGRVQSALPARRPPVYSAWAQTFLLINDCLVCFTEEIRRVGDSVLRRKVSIVAAPPLTHRQCMSNAVD